MTMVSLSCPMGSACSYTTEKVGEPTALALLDKHERMAHPSVLHGTTNSKKPEKFPRPSIDLDSTSESWQEFFTAWQQYQDEYNLTGKASTRQLYACCSPELATSLSRTTGGTHFTLDEAKLMENIKKLAVRHQNPAVHVQEFLGLVQQPDEGVRHFLARLRGVASRCNFDVSCTTCTKSISYADSVIRFKLIAGLSDIEIKEDILSVDDKTLEDILKTRKAANQPNAQLVPPVKSPGSSRTETTHLTTENPAPIAGGKPMVQDKQKERKIVQPSQELVMHVVDRDILAMFASLTNLANLWIKDHILLARSLRTTRLKLNKSQLGPWLG